MTPEEQAASAAYPDNLDDYYCPAGAERAAFLAGVKWARENPPHRIHPDTLCPHGYRLADLRDGTDSCEGCP